MVVLCILLLMVFNQRGLENNSRLTYFLIDSGVSREAPSVLLRMKIWGTNVLIALTNPRTFSPCLTAMYVTYIHTEVPALTGTYRGSICPIRTTTRPWP